MTTRSMKVWWTTAAAASLLVSVVTADDGDDLPCRLWLAPSQLSGDQHMRYGLYAGVDYEINDPIPDTEIAIPLVDFFHDGNRPNPFQKGILDYLEGQMWTGEYSGTKFEGNISTNAFVPGVGSLGNHHALVTNTEWLQASVLLRERQDWSKPGQAHPSRGAITNVHNLTMVATQRIPAGMELFPNFGDMWDNEQPGQFEEKLTRKDFAEADQVLDRILDYFDKFGDQMSDQLKDDTLDFMLDKVVAAAGGKRGKVVKSLIPENHRKLSKVRDAGGTFLYRYNDLVQKPKWLKKHGVCVDTLTSGLSTIPDAGRGAFATRDIAEGDRITIMPTTLWGQRELLDMFEINTVAGPEGAVPPRPATHTYDRAQPRGKQLIVNYAFGHPESTFLLVPDAPGVALVNHADEPNARVQWSTHEYLINDHTTHDYSVEEVVNYRSNMILLEMVATRDIARGEEVFIDYQPEWVAAWEAYKTEFDAEYADAPWPLKAEDIRATFRDRAYPLVNDASTLFPAHVATACFIKYDSVPDGTRSETEDGLDIYMWTGPLVYEKFSGTDLMFCDLQDVTTTDEGQYKYTVMVKLESEGRQYLTQINDVPHSAITLMDKPYHSDIHWEGAFRHHIGIPDDQFPQNWRDLRN